MTVILVLNDQNDRYSKSGIIGHFGYFKPPVLMKLKNNDHFGLFEIKGQSNGHFG